MEAAGLVGKYLRYEIKASNILSMCGVQKMQKVDYYLDVILPTFGSLQFDHQTRHLRYLCDLFRERDEQFLTHKNKFRDSLKNLKFLPIGGERKQISELFDPQDPVLSVFPVAPFSDESWRDFLLFIGLQRMNPDLIVECAHRVSTLPTECQIIAGRLLTCYIFKILRSYENRSAFNQLSTIAFVPAMRNGAVGIFSPGSIALPKDEDYIGLVLPVVRCLAESPEQQSMNDVIATAIGISTPPTLHHVLLNWIAMSDNSTDTRAVSIVSDGSVIVAPSLSKQRNNISLAMDFCRQRCANSADAEMIREMLRGKRCLDFGDKFYSVERVFLDIEVGLAPYIFPIPKSLIHYEELLKVCGVQAVPSFQYISDILVEIHRVSRSLPLEINQIDKVHRAVEHLLSCRPPLTISDLQKLYLPDSDLRLCIGEDLVFNDAPILFSRMVCDSVRIIHPRISITLSKQFPTLSSIIREEFDEDFVPKIVDDAKPDQWTQTLNSRQFWDGAIRLLNGSPAAAAELTTKLKQLAEYRILFVEGLCSKLINTRTGVDVTKSSEGARVFTDTTKKVIYVINDGRAPLFLAMQVNQILGVRLQNLADIISCEPNKISDLLDLLGVKTSVADWVPTAGKELYPWDEEDSGEDIVQVYENGQWVVWEDPSGIGRYGKIVRSVGAVNGNQYIQQYLVNVGDVAPIRASSLSLKNFRRRENYVPFSTTVEVDICEPSDNTLPLNNVPVDDNSEGKEGETQEENTQSAAAEERERRWRMSLAEKMDEVKKLISEIWKEDEGLHRRAFKRLYLSWHPDKNPDCQEDCTAVSQYIQSELERGPPRGGSPGSNTGNSSSGFGGYSSSAPHGGNHNAWWGNFQSEYRPRAGRRSSPRSWSSNSSGGFRGGNNHSYGSSNSSSSSSGHQNSRTCNHSCPFHCC